ncbi:MAG TPA: hypothetical protein VFC63_05515, partial [Blastocatellia bacterium]|nr:hypothetical protein [Blastocatellia bacterium]
MTDIDSDTAIAVRKSADVAGRQKSHARSSSAVFFSRKMKDIDPNTAISLQCPACSHEFPMSAAVLRSVQATIAKDLQADLIRRETQIEERLNAAEEKESAVEKRAATLDEDVQKLVDVRLRDEVEKVRKSEAKKAADAQGTI